DDALVLGRPAEVDRDVVERSPHEADRVLCASALSHLAHLKVSQAHDRRRLPGPGDGARTGQDGLTEDGLQVLVGQALGLLHLDGAGAVLDLLVRTVGEADSLAALRDGAYGEVEELIAIEFVPAFTLQRAPVATHRCL
ncbi:hypothetical protein CEE85_11615, partial [Lactobacillus crispatus]